MLTTCTLSFKSVPCHHNIFHMHSKYETCHSSGYSMYSMWQRLCCASIYSMVTVCCSDSVAPVCTVWLLMHSMLQRFCCARCTVWLQYVQYVAATLLRQYVQYGYSIMFTVCTVCGSDSVAPVCTVWLQYVYSMWQRLCCASMYSMVTVCLQHVQCVAATLLRTILRMNDQPGWQDAFRQAQQSSWGRSPSINADLKGYVAAIARRKVYPISVLHDILNCFWHMLVGCTHPLPGLLPTVALKAARSSSETNLCPGICQAPALGACLLVLFKGDVHCITQICSLFFCSVLSGFVSIHSALVSVCHLQQSTVTLPV